LLTLRGALNVVLGDVATGFTPAGVYPAHDFDGYNHERFLPFRTARLFFFRATDLALVHFDFTFKSFSFMCYECRAQLVQHVECGLVSLDPQLFLELESRYAWCKS
jgi:hypothetical protein